MIVSYNGHEIRALADLRAQIKAGRDAKDAEIPMVLRRGDETIEITLGSGRVGIRCSPQYAEPAFE